MSAEEQFYGARSTDRAIIDDRLRKVITFVLKRMPSRLLDIGCGRGTLIAELTKYMPTDAFVGTEISEQLCRAARSNGVSVVTHNVVNPLPFPDASFDAVIFGEVIEHLFDPDFVLDEIYRVLVPSGTLILTTPNLACWLNRILVPLGIQPIFTETSTRKKYGRRFAALGQNSTEMEGHIRVMTTTALLELLRDRGYGIERVAGVRFAALERHPITGFIDGRCCSWPAFASGVIVVCSISGRRE